jgi:hypothetical protein
VATKHTKVVITKQRAVHTYAELWQASNFVLQVGIRQPQGSACQFLSSLVLTAFAFEAYLNHIGPESLACWEELERLPPLAKLRLLAETLKVKLPWHSGKRPLQTIVKLMSFRNSIAHGRSSELKYQATRNVNFSDRELFEPLLSDWERQSRTSAFPLRAREDVEAVLRLLQAGRKNTTDNLFTTGIGHGSASLAP